MTKDEFLQSGLLEQYVLGISTEEEDALVEQWLEKDPSLRMQVEEMQSALSTYAQAATSEHQESNMGPYAMKRRGIFLPFGWAATLALLIVAGAFFAWQSFAQQQQQALRVQAESAAKLDDCIREKAQLENESILFASVRLPSTHHVMLTGTENAPNAFAVAHWNPELQKAWIDPQQLPPLPSDHQYQVWADIDGEMISIGLIPNNSNSMQDIEYLPQAASINITPEVLGGAEHPHVAQLTVNGRL